MRSFAAGRAIWRSSATRMTSRWPSRTCSTPDTSRCRSFGSGAHATASGVPFDHLWGYVVEVRDRQIAYIRAYYEPDEALEAAGLRE
jgi:ketosteroid isomerase-like protein